MSVKNTKWIRVDNTHEPLISQEVFDNANAKIMSRRRDTADNFVSPFSGLVKCGACGKALGLRYWTKSRKRIYICTTYAHDTKKCTDHRIFYPYRSPGGYNMHQRRPNHQIHRWEESRYWHSSWSKHHLLNAIISKMRLTVRRIFCLPMPEYLENG